MKVVIPLCAQAESSGCYETHFKKRKCDFLTGGEREDCFILIIKTKEFIFKFMSKDWSMIFEMPCFDGLIEHNKNNLPSKIPPHE
jgi:hypothetical protein